MLSAVGNRQNVQTWEVGYPTIGKDTVLSPPASKVLILHSIAAQNANATACDIGLGLRLANASWKVYTLISGVAADVTSSIQGGTATALFDTSNNDGFLVQCKEPFSLVYMDISQAQSGSPAYDYAYWNGASWVTLNLLNSPSYAGTGAAYVAFLPPVDWAQGSGGLISASIQGNAGYTIRIRSTTAGGQAVNMDAMKLTKFYTFRGAVPSKQQLQVRFDNRPEILEASEGVGVYFSTANNANVVDVAYQIGG